MHLVKELSERHLVPPSSFYKKLSVFLLEIGLQVQPVFILFLSGFIMSSDLSAVVSFGLVNDAEVFSLFDRLVSVLIIKIEILFLNRCLKLTKSTVLAMSWLKLLKSSAFPSFPSNLVF